MSTARTLAKNTTVLLAAQIISIAVSLTYLSYSARYLTPDGFSIMSFALSFTTVFAYFADFGFSTLTAMKVARDKSQAGKYLGNLAALRIFLSVLLVLVMAVVINVGDYPEQTIQVVYIIAISTVLYVLNGLFNSLFQAFEKMEYQSIGTVLYSVLMFSGTFLAIHFDLGLMGFAFINLATNLLVIIYSLIVSALFIVKPKMELDPRFLKTIIIESLPFGIGGFFLTIYYSIDSLLLFNMQAQDVLGWYSASSRLVHYLQVVPLMVNTALFPAMSRFFISSPDNLKLIYEKYMKFMLVIGVPMAVGATVLADKIIWTIYGDGYSPSIVVMQIVIWSVFLSFVYTPFLQTFSSTNHQRLTTVIIGIGMLVNFALNIILIPLLSYIGSSFALVMSELTMLVISFYYATRLGFGIKGAIIVQILSRVAAASMVMGAFLWLLKSWNILVLIPCGILVYFVSLYAAGGIDSEDLSLVRSILKGKYAAPVKNDQASTTSGPDK
ncbi:putative polysaccharide biosynthesis protein [Methanocella paludicola SANAE]|uniref:Polysaccharide biosynthesis protein n=1 Tax=Methanocella paludicola (strain DSM 17711 / JCM 13418 / NBRC 101707 / SANAE) TaxID=304371 RepID=D1Z261_METPS|nr:flippase [Methanocella paludicola]BAI62783.1 putative polysaccharide biosynthesis protein [Methanocella paludicola SANAE]